MTVRLFVSDIDGTLVRDDKSLSDGNVAAIRRLTDAGVPVTLISARPPSGIKWIAERLGLRGPFGAFNGGTLFLADGAVTERHRIDPDVARVVLDHLATVSVTPWLFADDAWLTPATDPVHTPREIKSAGLDPTITRDFGDRATRADKIVAVSDDGSLLDRVEQDLRSRLGDQATIARSQPYYLDVTAPAANKGDGIAALAAAYGVDLRDTVALGDQYNDLPMFARAGVAIAMGQGPEKVRAAAAHVARANDDDGVSDAIDRFVLPGISR